MVSKRLFFLLSILLSMVGSKALAAYYDIEVENADGVTIYYNYINNGTELEVTSKYRGSNSYSSSVVIPEEVTYMNRTRKVTSIGEYAFEYCSDLTSITIPNSVTNIGGGAFSHCDGLKSITIPSSVTSIGKEAFYDCDGLTSITIPNSVTSIGIEAFYDCNGLTSVTIGTSVTSIGEYAFRRCTGLTSIKIPNSVTSIGDGAFRYCSGLTSVTIGNSVTSIGDYAFQNCSSLTSITIPNSLTSIGKEAFSGWDLPEVISKIDNPFKIKTNTFSDNTFYNATLYVPAGTIDKYKATEGWMKFAFIEEGNGGGDTPPSKCEKPTITFKDGKLTFSCATEGVTYQYSITASDVKNGAGNDIDFAPKYTITAYATKAGYENSETATLEISVNGGANGDVNGDGVVDAADVVKLVNIIMGE